MYGYININKPDITLHFGFSIPEFRYPHKERLCIRNKNVIFYKNRKNLLCKIHLDTLIKKDCV